MSIKRMQELAGVKSNKNQTSIEWFYDQITRTYWDYMTTERQNELFEQAKEMEKNQIVKAYGEGVISESGSDYIGMNEETSGEMYYDRNYK